MFDFDIERVVSEILNRGSRKVLLQFPDGLKPFSKEVIDQLSSRLPDREFVISAEPSFGACDISEDEVTQTGVDLIVHFGHSPYPWYFPKFPTVFVSVKHRLDLNREVLDRLYEKLMVFSPATVGLTATVQYTDLMDEVKKYLTNRGITVRLGKPSIPSMADGQVLGCDYRAVPPADVQVHISGGMFHALGVGLSSGSPTLKLDPDRGGVVDITGEVERVLRVRYSKIVSAMDSQNWGIIQGLKLGQNRPLMVEGLKRSLERTGRSVYVFTSKYLSKDVIRNVDRSSIGAYVVTSCPRLPTDDLYDFEKPVLTPGEARMVINNRLEPYIFPW